MDLSRSVKSRSKDPRTQVGAVIVDDTNRIVSLGFNGPPACIKDDLVPWDEDKYPWIIHAEQNAILFGLQYRHTLQHCSIYVTGIPCSKCMLLIAAMNIKTVIYGAEQPVMCDEKDQGISRHIAEAAGIQLLRSLS